MKNIFTEKFMEVIKYEGAVSLVTWSTIGVNVSNTWNSYLRVPRDGRILIPAAGMKKTEKNVELKVLCQLGGSKSNSKHYEIRN